MKGQGSDFVIDSVACLVHGYTGYDSKISWCSAMFEILLERRVFPLGQPHQIRELNVATFTSWKCSELAW